MARTGSGRGTWQLCGRHRPRHRCRERRHSDPVDDESGRRSDQQGQSHKAADVRTRKLPTSATASSIGRLTIDEDNKGLVEHPVWISVGAGPSRSEEHTSELQSLMRISYAVFCLKKKNNKHKHQKNTSSSTNKKMTIDIASR